MVKAEKGVKQHAKNRSLWFWLLFFSTTLASIDLVNTFVWNKPFTTSHLVAYPIAVALSTGGFYLLNKLISRVKRFQMVLTYFISFALVCLLVGGGFYPLLRASMLTGLIAGMVLGTVLIVVMLVAKRFKQKRKRLI